MPSAAAVTAPPLRSSSISGKLKAMVWLMVLPTLLLSMMAGVAVFQTEQRAAINAAMETAEALSLVTDREMAVRSAMLQALSIAPSLAEGRLDQFHAEARRLVAGSASTIALTREDGQQMINTRVDWGVALPKTSIFRPDVTPNRPLMVSDLYTGPHDKRLSFAVRVPVTVAGQPMRLGLGSPVTDLQQIFRQQPLPKGWLGVVLDSQGYVAARTLDPDKRAGQRASAAMLEAMAKADRGVVETKTLDGVPVFTVFARAPDSGWLVLIGLSRGQLAHTAWMAFGVTLCVSFIFIVVATLVARRIGGSIVRPLQGLRDDALAMGSGERVQATASGLEDVDIVQRALVAASEERSGHEQRMRAEIEAAVAQARQAQEAALRSQKLEALGRLTGGIAHDFNNLLQTMTTGLQLAKKLSADPRADQALAACQRATAKASQLTRQLLAFGRQQVGHESVLDLREQLPELMELVRGAVGSAIDSSLEMEDGLWPVRTDPVQLELAILNLALNARDALHGRGRLTIRAANRQVVAGEVTDLLAGDYVCITVVDDGDGMTQDQMAHAFEPFFTTKPVGQGTGLGLAQVYALARATGGTATLNSKIGLGTEVVLWLPRSLGRTRALEAQAPASGQRYGGTVLLVEDDASVRELTAQALEDLGFSVMTAPTADQALDLLRGGAQVDVVLSDIVMPGTRSGVDLARTLKVLKPTLPVVLASGHPVGIEEAPDVPLVAKPYDTDQVAAQLAAAMDLARSSLPPAGASAPAAAD